MTPVYWTPEALARLEAIEAYIVNDAPIFAKEVITRLLGRSRQLETAPLSGRAVPEYPPRTCVNCWNGLTESSTASPTRASRYSP